MDSPLEYFLSLHYFLFRDKRFHPFITIFITDQNLKI
mgnify:CR=1 FL=1